MVTPQLRSSPLACTGPAATSRAEAEAMKAAPPAPAAAARRCSRCHRRVRCCSPHPPGHMQFAQHIAPAGVALGGGHVACVAHPAGEWMKAAPSARAIIPRAWWLPRSARAAGRSCPQREKGSDKIRREKRAWADATPHSGGDHSFSRGVHGGQSRARPNCSRAERRAVPSDRRRGKRVSSPSVFVSPFHTCSDAMLTTPVNLKPASEGQVEIQTSRRAPAAFRCAPARLSRAAPQLASP